MATSFDTFNSLYQDFSESEFFSSAYKDISWTKEGQGVFDPITGTTTGSSETFSGKAFKISSASISRKPSSDLFEEIIITDVFAITRLSDLEKPDLTQKVTLDGKEYTLINMLYDAIELTYIMQLRS